MATRSTIAAEFADGQVAQIYCHHDGYLNHNGQLLQDYYCDLEKVKQLIDQGDMSSLGKNIDANGVDPCIFYIRDRGEINCIASWYKNYEDYLINKLEEEYNYVLRSVNGKSTWFVQHQDSNNKFELLETAFRRLEVESLK